MVGHHVAVMLGGVGHEHGHAFVAALQQSPNHREGKRKRPRRHAISDTDAGSGLRALDRVTRLVRVDHPQETFTITLLHRMIPFRCNPSCTRYNFSDNDVLLHRKLAPMGRMERE